MNGEEPLGARIAGPNATQRVERVTTAGAGVLPPPGLVTPRGALRRSLVCWGWGHVATGDRRGVLLALLEVAAIAALAVSVPTFLDGTLSILLYLAGAAFVGAWGAIALHAYRRAVARRAPYVRDVGNAPGDAPAGDGGAVELLWLAPVLIVTTSAFWAMGGTLGSPESTLASYVRDWRGGYAAEANSLFAAPSAAGVLSAAWSRQWARLHNALVPVAATSGEDSGVDPNDPLDSLRFAFDDASADKAGTRLVHVQTVRRESVRDTFFGLVPTTTQQLVTIADVGTLTLTLVPNSGAPGGNWRIASVDVLDEHLGG